MSFINTIKSELSTAAKVLNDFMNDKECLESVEQAAMLMSEAIKKGGKLISCGNGGSACDAMHFAEELTGRYRENRKAIPALSISETGHITCTANDFGYEYIFSRYIEALGNHGDVVLAITTSGNSKNVLKAVEQAKAKGLKTVGLSGKTGGQLQGKVDILIKVPYEGYADRIQEVHIKIIHILIQLIEQEVTNDHQTIR